MKNVNPLSALRNSRPGKAAFLLMPLLCCLLLVLVTSGCSSSSSALLDQVKQLDHHALQPTPKTGWWLQRHQAILERIRQGNVNLIFIGDSITQGWEKNLDVWNKYYGHRQAVNLGYAGDRTEHVLWRFEHGEIDGIAPKLAVVMIGTNNCPLNRGYSEQQITDGIIRICARLRQKLPRTKILLLGIFPRHEHPSPLRDKINNINNMIAPLDDGRNIFYRDINDRFLVAQDRLPPEVMPDFLHPNKAGYLIWAQAIESMVTRLLKE